MDGVVDQPAAVPVAPALPDQTIQAPGQGGETAGLANNQNVPVSNAVMPAANPPVQGGENLPTSAPGEVAAPPIPPAGNLPPAVPVVNVTANAPSNQPTTSQPAVSPEPASVTQDVNVGQAAPAVEPLSPAMQQAAAPIMSILPAGDTSPITPIAPAEPAPVQEQVNVVAAPVVEVPQPAVQNVNEAAPVNPAQAPPIPQATVPIDQNQPIPGQTQAITNEQAIPEVKEQEIMRVIPGETPVAENEPKAEKYDLPKSHPLHDLYSNVNDKMMQSDLMIQQEMEAERRHESIDELHQEAEGWRITNYFTSGMMALSWLLVIVTVIYPMVFAGENGEQTRSISFALFVVTIMFLLAGTLISVWTKTPIIMKRITWLFFALFIILFVLVSLKSTGLIQKDIPIINTLLTRLAF